MRFKILVTAPYLQSVIDRFRRLFDEHHVELVIPPVAERLEEDRLLPLVGDVDGVICGDDRFTARVLEAAGRLRVISKWGTGIDSIDLEACRARGVVVCNTPDAFTAPVADSVLGYILCFARRLPDMDRSMHRGVWEKVPGRALQECTLGVIGVGHIGKAVVRRALVFGMRVIGNDIVEMPGDFLSATDIEMMSKEQLLPQADFISLNCTLNPGSYHLMGDAQLAVVKPSAVLINTARGPIIDEPALVRALQEKRLAGAALDVFEEEPLPPDSPLRAMDNVMLAPHNSNSSPQAWQGVHEKTIRNLLEVLRRTRT